MGFQVGFIVKKSNERKVGEKIFVDVLSWLYEFGDRWEVIPRESLPGRDCT